MKIALIIIGGIIVLGINFVLYCCFLVASREEEYLKKMDAAMARNRDDDG